VLPRAFPELQDGLCFWGKFNGGTGYRGVGG